MCVTVGVPQLIGDGIQEEITTFNKEPKLATVLSHKFQIQFRTPDLRLTFSVEIYGKVLEDVHVS